MENQHLLATISKNHFKKMIKELSFVVIITIPLLILDDVHNINRGPFYFIYPNLIYISIFYLLSLNLTFKVHFSETEVRISYITRFWKKVKTISYGSITELRWANQTISSGSDNKAIFIINGKKTGWSYASKADFEEIKKLIEAQNPKVACTYY